MAATPILRIFLSSPGDVAEERQLAREVIARLNKDHLLKGRIWLEPVGWDDPDAPPSMPANPTPQAAVNRGLVKPSDCDIVVVLLWNRMGTELDPSEGLKADGQPYRSGTEWEFEDAFNAPTQPERPAILLYRRTGFTPDASDPDDPKLQAQLDQRRQVNAFFAALRDKKRFATEVADPTDFGHRLENDLKHQIRLLLEDRPGPLVDAYRRATPTAVGDRPLSQAQALLATMPLETVPTPAPLPTGSHMPLARNALFVGREADLKALASALKAGETAAVGQVASVTGLGGIGKTQLASEFVHRYGQYFLGGVFWLGFADPAAVPAEIATCGGQGGLNLHDDFGSLSLEDQVRLVAAEWQGPLPRLLVFDNCEDEALLDRWRPRTGGSHVLVTSRRETWSPDLGVHALPLGALARQASIDLLGRFRPDLEQSDPLLNDIADELGDLPLALHLAGSFLARYRHSELGQPARYLEQHRRSGMLDHHSLTLGGRSPTGHEQHVARTFALSHDRLDASDAVDALARTALACAAYFAPGEPIPRHLLRLGAGIPDDESSELRFEDSLARLRTLGLLVAQPDGALLLHRLLAAFVQGQPANHATLRAGVEAAVAGEAARLNRAGYPAPLLSWQSQLRFLAERAAETGSDDASVLLNELGYHLRTLADLAGARAAYERALQIDEANFGPDHPNVARDVNNLGNVLQDLGKLAGARAAFERALRIDEANFGPDHPNIARDINNLGCVLHSLRDLVGARAAYERALEIDKTNFGPDHANVAREVINLGSLRYDLNDLPGARAAFERAAAILEKQHGPEHADVGCAVNNLGGVLLALDDLPGARAAFERALRIDEGWFGPSHPDVAMRHNNLGGALRALGDLAGARAAFERALSILERTPGPDHPKTRTVRANLESLGAG